MLRQRRWFWWNNFLKSSSFLRIIALPSHRTWTCLCSGYGVEGESTKWWNGVVGRGTLAILTPMLSFKCVFMIFSFCWNTVFEKLQVIICNYMIIVKIIVNLPIFLKNIWCVLDIFQKYNKKWIFRTHLKYKTQCKHYVPFFSPVCSWCCI